MAMVGIAAVGLVGGRFLIVDLGLDAMEVNLSYSFADHDRDVYHLALVQPHEEYIVHKRRAAMTKKKAICLDCNGEELQH